MLISEHLLFLHVPKTGGRSVSDYLVNNLRGPMAESLGYKADLSRPRRVAFDDVTDRLSVFRGRRHEDLQEATEVLSAQGRRLSDFDVVLAVVRNPYDLEVSHYEHLRKPRVVARRGAASVPVRAAATGDFAHFVEHAPFFGRLPAEMERWYRLDGSTPPNLRIVRFEGLAAEIPELVAPFGAERWPFPHINASVDRRPWLDYLTPEIEAAIYDKYRYLFDVYPRVELS